MRRHMMLAVLLIMAACSKGPGEAWQELPDGSFGRLQASGGSALNNSERCWPAGEQFDCISITRQKAPALLVVRQMRADYRDPAGPPPHYACRFDPDYSVWFEQLLSRRDVRRPEQVDRRNSISRASYTAPWSKDDVMRIAAEAKVPAPVPYIDCVRMNDMLVLGSVEMLLRPEVTQGGLTGG